MTRAVILVEGESDRRAVLVAGRVLGLDLSRVEVVAMGGITNLPAHLLGISDEVPVSGLYDDAQETYVSAVLRRLERRSGFFACHQDLEDELVRALGHDRVRAVISAAGDGAAYRTLRRQPYHRGRPESSVLRRFMGTTSGRKLLYAELLTEALAPAEVPGPLVAVLSDATA